MYFRVGKSILFHFASILQREKSGKSRCKEKYSHCIKGQQNKKLDFASHLRLFVLIKRLKVIKSLIKNKSFFKH